MIWRRLIILRDLTRREDMALRSSCNLQCFFFGNTGRKKINLKRSIIHDDFVISGLDEAAAEVLELLARLYE